MRADGVRVHGHWRHLGSASSLRRVSRPEGSDLEIRNFLSSRVAQTSALGEIPPGEYPPTDVFYGLLATSDDEGYAKINDTLAKLGEVHTFRSTKESPLHFCPILNGQILSPDAPEDAVSSGCYNAAPRDPEISEEEFDPDIHPCYPASIFVSVEHADDADISLLHEIGHYVDQQMIGDGRYESTKAAFSEDRKASSLGRLMNKLEKSRALQAIAYTRDSVVTVDALVRRSDGTVTRKRMEVDRDFCSYLLDPIEAFARAYSQWVALRANMSESREFILNRTLSRGALYPEQWDDDDFEPIAREFDRLFKSHLT